MVTINLLEEVGVVERMGFVKERDSSKMGGFNLIKLIFYL